MRRGHGGVHRHAAAQPIRTTGRRPAALTNVTNSKASAAKPGASKGKAKAQPMAKRTQKSSAVDDELLAWLKLYKVEKYLPQLQKLGIRAVNDFKEMDPSDIASLKLNKFDHKRFMEGLKTSVPEFLIYANARTKGSDDGISGNGHSCTSELLSWLTEHGLDEYLKHFTAIGVRTLADISEMDDSDIRKVKLNKFDKRRFLAAVEEVNAPSKKAFVTKPFAGIGSNKMTFQEAMLRKNPVSVSMANASQMARESCLKANIAQRANTISTFHNQWRAVQQARKKQTCFAQLHYYG